MDATSTTSSTPLSLESLDADADTLTSVMEDLKQQMAALAGAAGQIRGQVKSLFKRAKYESISWMDQPLTPKTPAVAKWCSQRQLPATPTLQQFLEAVFAAADSLDLETRVLTFSKKDAVSLWAGQRRLTVFELIAQLPMVFA